LLELSLLLDPDPRLLLLQRTLALEVELQLVGCLPLGHGLLLAPLLGLPVERHVAGEAAPAPPTNIPGPAPPHPGAARPGA
jgi:hypothetical protein